MAGTHIQTKRKKVTSQALHMPTAQTSRHMAIYPQKRSCYIIKKIVKKRKKNLLQSPFKLYA